MSAMPSLTDSKAHEFEDFPAFLASTLRVGTKLRVYHVSTHPTACPPIFASAPGKEDEVTTCESHFLAISQRHVTNSGIVADKESTKKELDEAEADDHVLVLGIEVLMFSTNSLTTIFVSKADSTGFLPRSKTSTQGSSSIIRGVISAFVEWLVSRNLSARTPEPPGVTEHGTALQSTRQNGVHKDQADVATENYSSVRPNRKKLVLSLFARSQNQYLFPGSIENQTKHVLDDRQLIKWWCRLLDGLIQKNWKLDARRTEAQTSSTLEGISADAQYGQSSTLSVTPNAFVVVPGCDRSETIRSFFPPSAKQPLTNQDTRWHNQFPIQFLRGDSVDISDAALPVRCVIPRFPDDPKSRYCNDLDGSGSDDKGQWRDIKSLQQFWEAMEYRQECAAGRLVGFVWVTFDPAQTAEVPKAIGAIGNENSTSNVPKGYVESTDVHLPPIGAKSPAVHVTLSNEQYIELSDLLVNDTDFAGLQIAVKSTKEWVAKVTELSGVVTFGFDVEGQLPLPSASEQLSTNANPEVLTPTLKEHEANAKAPQINVLTGFKKKKRKVDEQVEADPGQAQNGASADLDGRAEQDMAANPTSEDGVTLLSAGLIRKKPKTAI